MRVRHESPCDRECPDRSGTCHGKCERYASFVAQMEKRRKMKANDRTWTSAKVTAYNLKVKQTQKY